VGPYSLVVIGGFTFNTRSGIVKSGKEDGALGILYGDIKMLGSALNLKLSSLA